MAGKNEPLYTARLNVKVTPKLLSDLHKVAAKQGLDKSSYVRSVLTKKIQEDK